MKKTYKIKTNHVDFSLLAHIATQVWDLDPEIKCIHNFAAKRKLAILSPNALVTCVNDYCVSTT